MLKVKYIKSRIITLLMLIVAIAVIAGIFIGNYFVNFAFQRCYDSPYNGMPKASEIIVSKDVLPAKIPDFPFETCNINMLNGEKRNGTLFTSNPIGHTYIILVHGYCRSQSFVWDYATYYLQAGYNVLTPDLNASGSSDGQYLTMGCVESDDVVAWAKKLVQRDPEARIVLHGISMGAATVMLSTAKDLPPQVVAAIEDCGYTTAYDMFVEQLWKNYSLPGHPVMDAINVVNRVKTGYFLTDASPIKAVIQTKIPMLFIHGNQDKLVPQSMEDELYEVSGAPIKEKIVVDGAGHADSFSKDNDKYFQHIFDFLARNIEKKPV